MARTYEAALPGLHRLGSVSISASWVASSLGSWKYAGGKRDLRLDLLRGFAGFAMIVDHVGSAEHSWLANFTGGNHFFVSAAEAFVFISGLVMGIVYQPLIKKTGVSAALHKALKRAWTLYLVTVSVGLTFIALSLAVGTAWAPKIVPGHEASFVIDFVTLRRTFYLVDIPMMYTFLLLLAIPALYLLSRGHALIVLAASWGLWALWQASPGTLDVPWRVEDNTVFHVSAWQVLFITGLVIGWYRGNIERLVGRLPQQVALAGIAVVVGAAAFLYFLQVVALPSLQANSLVWSLFFDKPNVPVGRLLAFAIFTGFAFVLVSYAWRPIKSVLGWMLLPLGQNALTAYSLHLFVALVVSKAVGASFEASVGHSLTTSVQVLSVLAVWGALTVEPKLRELSASAMSSARLRIAATHWLQVSPDDIRYGVWRLAQR